MKTSALLNTACLAACCAACVSELDSKLIPPTTYTVVNSFISPDMPVLVDISQSASILDTVYQIPDINDMLLFDRFEIEEYRLVKTESGKYGLHRNQSLSSGHIYEIQVNMKSGEQITAQTSIPNPAKINKATRLYPAGLDNEGIEISEYNIAIEDDPNADNYYEMFILYVGWKGEMIIDENEFWTYTDPVIEAEGLEDFENTSLLFSDNLFSGKSQTIKLRGGGGGATFTPFFPINGSFEEKIVVLLTCSKEYYDLKRSWEMHKYLQQSKPAVATREFIIDDIRKFLFKGDVQPLESNISGGVGVFAGFSVTIFPIEML